MALKQLVSRKRFAVGGGLIAAALAVLVSFGVPDDALGCGGEGGANLDMSEAQAALGGQTTPSTLPALVNQPDPNGLYTDPDAEQRVGGINVFRKTIHGLVQDTGVASLQWNDTTGTGAPISEVGNFALRGLNFKRGQVMIPRATGFIRSVPLEVSPWIGTAPASNGVVQLGAQRLALGPSRCGGYPSSTRCSYSSTTDRRFIVWVASSSSRNSITGNYVSASAWIDSLWDSETGIAYTFEAAPAGGFRAKLAKLADGSVITYAWDGSNRLTTATLARAGATAETLTLTYSGTTTRILTIAHTDAALTTRFEYVDTKLAAARIGGAVGLGIDGLEFDYTQVGGTGYTLTGLRNLAGKAVVSWGLAQTPSGTVYDRVYIGPATLAPIQITYAPADGITARITAPSRPQDPIDMVLDPVRGRVLRAKEASNPNWSEWRYYVSGEDADPYLMANPYCPGQLKQEVIPNREKLLTRTYAYTGSCERREIREEADGVTTVTQLATSAQTLWNGIKSSRPSRIIDPMGLLTELSYSSGHLFSVKTDAVNGGLAGTPQGGVTVNRSYTWASDLVSLATQRTTYPNGRQDEEAYDGRGNLTRATADAGGDPVTSTFSYDPTTGRLTGATGTRGNVATVTYKAADDDRIDTIVLRTPSGEEHRVKFEYVAAFPGLVASQTTTQTVGGSAQASTLEYTYLDLNADASPDVPRVTRVRSTIPTETGTTTAVLGDVSYDPATLRITRACGFSANQTTAESCTSYSYYATGTKTGLLDYTTDAAGYRTTLTYDATGRPDGAVRQIDQATSREVHLGFDGRGRVTSVATKPQGGAVLREQQTTYDLAGKPTRTRVLDGGQLIAEAVRRYANGGSSTRVEGVDQLDPLTGQVLATAIYQYDTPDRSLSRQNVARASGTVLADVTLSDFDRYSRARNRTVYVDGRGLASTRTVWNKFGDPETLTDALGNSTSLQFDSLGRRSRVDGPLALVTYAYTVASGRDRVTATSNFKTTNAALAYAHASTTEYDAWGRAILSTDPATGITSTYDYDNRSRLFHAINQYTRGGTASDTTTYLYDALNRVTGANHHSGSLGDESLGAVAFDGLGRAVGLYDARGNLTSTQYDLLDRPIHQSYPNGKAEDLLSIHYAASEPFLTVQTRDAANATTTFKFDSRGRPTERRRDDGSFLRSYQYDAAGRLWTVTAGTASATYLYDSYGRVRSQSTPMGELQTAYTPQGRVSSTTYPTGSVATYGRDNFGRVSSILLDGQPVSSSTYDGLFLVEEQNDGVARSYAYAAGVPLLASITDTVSGQPLRSASYANYDPRLRIVDRVTDTPTSRRSEHFGYDANQSLLTSYTVDTAPALNYGTKLDGQMSGYGAVDPMFQYTDRYTYTPRGEPDTERTGAQRRFVWGELGLKEIRSGAQQLLAQITADPLGRITGVTTGANDYRFVRSGGMVLEQTDATKHTLTVFNPDTGRPVVSVVNGTTRYSHVTDGNNTTVALRNAAANQTISFSYSDLYPSQPTVEGPVAWADLPNLTTHGMPSVPELGLSIADHRVVDHGSRRFLNRDPLRYVDGMNMYQYATGYGVNPVTHRDPTGLEREDWIDPPSPSGSTLVDVVSGVVEGILNPELPDQANEYISDVVNGETPPSSLVEVVISMWPNATNADPSTGGIESDTVAVGAVAVDMALISLLGPGAPVAKPPAVAAAEVTVISSAGNVARLDTPLFRATEYPGFAGFSDGAVGQTSFSLSKNTAINFQDTGRVLTQTTLRDLLASGGQVIDPIASAEAALAGQLTPRQLAILRSMIQSENEIRLLFPAGSRFPFTLAGLVAALGVGSETANAESEEGWHPPMLWNDEWDLTGDPFLDGLLVGPPAPPPDSWLLNWLNRLITLCDPNSWPPMGNPTPPSTGGTGGTGTDDTGTGGTGTCFVAGTPVTMADGTQKPIEEIRVGDEVMSYDTALGHTVVSQVTQTFVHDNPTGALVVINGQLRATGNHPFYANGQWVRADSLNPGDSLVTLGAAGAGVLATPLMSASDGFSVERVYNIEVAGQHNYFAGGILVHNKPPPEPSA